MRNARHRKPVCAARLQRSGAAQSQRLEMPQERATTARLQGRPIRMPPSPFMIILLPFSGSVSARAVRRCARSVDDGVSNQPGETRSTCTPFGDISFDRPAPRVNPSRVGKRTAGSPCGRHTPAPGKDHVAGQSGDQHRPVCCSDLRENGLVSCARR